MNTVNSTLPYNMEYDHRFIKYIRHARSKTLNEFSYFMGVDASTIGKLERKVIDYTPYYDNKLREAVKRLRISNVELVSIRTIIEQREKRGFYK
jgi:transcriptional regulator with XRE-family HTH domain